MIMKEGGIANAGEDAGNVGHKRKASELGEDEEVQALHQQTKRSRDSIAASIAAPIQNQSSVSGGGPGKEATTTTTTRLILTTTTTMMTPVSARLCNRRACLALCLVDCNDLSTDIRQGTCARHHKTTDSKTKIKM